MAPIFSFLDLTYNKTKLFYKSYLFVIRTMSDVHTQPIKEEAYAFIGCLYFLRKRYKLQGFNPDFTKKMFGPYILNKLSRTDEDIREAVKLWCSDPAAAEKKYGHISKWDVSHVINMDGLFRDCFSFNDDISGWDVSNVTTMQEMFEHAHAFNQPIGVWDVSNVTNIADMFNFARAFNQPLDAWNTSNMNNMECTFAQAVSFNQPLASWDVSKVTNERDMMYMFYGAFAFNRSSPTFSWM
jgi:surface protein